MVPRQQESSHHLVDGDQRQVLDVGAHLLQHGIESAFREQKGVGGQTLRFLDERLAMDQFPIRGNGEGLRGPFDGPGPSLYDVDMRIVDWICCHTIDEGSR